MNSLHVMRDCMTSSVGGAVVIPDGLLHRTACAKAADARHQRPRDILCTYFLGGMPRRVW
jgi:hypothetical protein